MPPVPVLGKLRQENSEFEVSLDYIETPCHKKPKQQTTTTTNEHYPPSRNHHSADLPGFAVEYRRCQPYPPCVPGRHGESTVFLLQGWLSSLAWGSITVSKMPRPGGRLVPWIGTVCLGRGEDGGELPKLLHLALPYHTYPGNASSAVTLCPDVGAT